MQTLRPAASLPLDGSRLGPARALALGSSVLVRLSKDEVLVREGDQGRTWHLVHWGAVALSATHPDGRRSMLSVLGPGDLWAPRLTSQGGSREGLLEARALIASVVQLIPATVMERLVRRDGLTAWWVCSRLRRNAERFQDALAGTLGMQVRDRVWRALVDLASGHGRPTREGVELSLPLAQETLASIVGATRESVNRAIKGLRHEGLVRRRCGRYVLATNGDDQRFGVGSP